MSTNIITAIFPSSMGSQLTYADPVYQYDYGMVLQFVGLSLPVAYEVHFANTDSTGNSITQIGNADGVSVPDELLLTGKTVYAWVYLHSTVDDGETVYKVVIPVNRRAKPTNATPTPVQQDAITEAIAALDAAVEQTAADVQTASGLVDDARGYASAADGSAQAAAGSAGLALTYAQSAAASAQTASEKASEILNLTGDATVDANTGTPSVEVTVSEVDDHKNMSFSFHNLKGDTGVGISSVILNADYTLTITLTNGTSYTTSSIRGEVGATPNLTIGTVSTLPEGSQATATITGTDEDPVLNLGIPVGDTGVGIASVEKTGTSGLVDTYTITYTDGTTSTFEVTNGQDGEVTEDALEERLIEKADVITSSASGEIVTIADGGNNMPVVDLSVSLLPVQDLHGQDAPYPPGGGVNKIGIADGVDFTLKGIRYRVEGGSLYLDGTATGETSSNDSAFKNAFSFVLGAGTYYFSRGSYGSAVYLKSESGNLVTNNGSFTITEQTTVWFGFYMYNVTFSNVQVPLSIVLGSNPPSSYSPFSNVCPISGWTGVRYFHTDYNLLKIDLFTTAPNDYQPVYNPVVNDITVTTNPARQYARVAQTIPVEKNTAYTISANYVFPWEHQNAKGLIYVGTTGGTQIAATEAFNMNGLKSLAFNSGNNTQVEVRFYVSRDSYYGYPAHISNVICCPTSVYSAVQNESAYIDWSSTAGTVYGGSLDLTTGVLKVDTEKVVVDGTKINQVDTASTGVKYARVSTLFSSTTGIVTCDSYPVVSSVPSPGAVGARFTSSRIYIYDDRFTDLATAQAILNANNVEFIIRNSTPTTYQLTPVQIQTLLGVNNFWSNGNGTLDLEYRADTKLYIEQLTKPTEDDMTANQNITSGSFFMVGNRLMLSTTAIAQGEQIVVGTNCSEVSLADALNQINA